MTLFDPELGSPLVRTIYTDGSCSHKDWCGGWAWVDLINDNHGSGGALNTTNQRMEIAAAFEAVKSNDGPVRIVSDSKYVVECFTNHWYVKWRKNDWMTYKREPVKNRDLWEPFIDLVELRDEITFWWVRGHDGNKGNERADKLAVWAMQRMR